MTAERLFKRQARVTIRSTTVPLFEDLYDVKIEGASALIIEDLRIEFSIEHNLKKHPNQCLVKITGLSQATRSALKKAPLKMVLEAGYEGGMAVIFQGDITYALSTLDGPDWVTEIQGGDGDRVFSNARVNKTYAPGTTIESVMKDAMASVGQELPDVIKNSSYFKETLQAGLAVAGKHKDFIPKILAKGGYTWSIQDGQPIILQTDQATGQTYHISEETGLIGSPEFGHPNRKGKAPDVTVRTLLYPEIRPGHPVYIKSRELDGLFKVKKVRHKGDTHGNDWVTEVEIQPGVLKKV